MMQLLRNMLGFDMRSYDAGADIKVMETEAYRQQKADEQQQGEQARQPFMNFSADEAATARNEAAQEAAQRKAGAAQGWPSPQE